jgi:hypothetical protein
MSKKKGRVRLSAVIVGLIAVGLVAWLLLRDGGDSSSKSGKAEIVSEDTLRETAADGGSPIYWAGPQANTQLELSQPSKGQTYVRYLTGDAEAGDARPNFLTVGTYAYANAVSALEELGKKPGGVLASAPGDATVYFNRNRGDSIYLAYPGVEEEIEVYDPNLKRALKLVSSGQIVPAN